MPKITRIRPDVTAEQLALESVLAGRNAPFHPGKSPAVTAPAVPSSTPMPHGLVRSPRIDLIEIKQEGK